MVRRFDALDLFWVRRRGNLRNAITQAEIDRFGAGFDVAAGAANADGGGGHFEPLLPLAEHCQDAAGNDAHDACCRFRSKADRAFLALHVGVLADHVDGLAFRAGNDGVAGTH